MKNKRLLSLSKHLKLSNSLARIAIFIVFGIATYYYGYIPFSLNKMLHDFASIIHNTQLAANDNHPLMAYTTDEPPGLIRLNEFSGGHYESGLAFLVSINAAFGRKILGNSYLVDDKTVYRIIYVFCAITAIVFLLPKVPLLLSLSGVAALATSITILPSTYNGFGIYLWGALYTVILIGMLLTTLVLDTKSSFLYIFAVALGLLASIAQFIRNEATIMAYLSCLIFFVIAWSIAFAMRFVTPDYKLWARTTLSFTRRITMSLFLFVSIIFISPYLVRAIFSLTFQEPYADTRVAMHGSGHSLYMSLGYLSNPYNISWRDNVAIIQSQLIAPGTRFDSSDYQRVLREEWLRIVLTSPGLEIENIFAKAKVLYTILKTTPIVSHLLVLFPLMLILYAIALIIRPTPDMLFICLGFWGIVVVTSLSPLIIFPFYNQGFVGTLLISVTIIPTALGIMFFKDTPWGAIPAVQLKRVVVGLTSGAILLIAGGGISLAVFNQFQKAQYRLALNKLMAGDQFAQVQEMGYRYAHLFNGLALDQQAAVIAQLQNVKHSRVATVTSKIQGETSYLRPVLVIFSNGQMHVIVWLGRPGPDLPYKDQGTASAFLRICAVCSDFPHFLANNPYHLTENDIARDVLGINDLDWQDRYRMFSFAVNHDVLQADFWRVGLQRLDSLDIPHYTYQMETLSSTRFNAQK